MAERTATVAASVGIHARPASLFVQAVKDTGADVTLIASDGRTVNAASILSVLSLGIPFGASVTLTSDDEAAVESLADLLETDLDKAE